MKRISVIFLIAFLFLSSPILAKDIEIKHEVEKISEFNVKNKDVSKIEGTEKIEIAEVKVRNNTRDGYKVEITCLNGFLKPSGSEDGEIEIGYTLSKTSSGTIPTATDAFIRLTVPSKPPTEATVVLGAETLLTGNDLLRVPTDFKFKLYVTVDNDDFINMAGNYLDTVSITYTDH